MKLFKKIFLPLLAVLIAAGAVFYFFILPKDSFGTEESLPPESSDVSEEESSELFESEAEELSSLPEESENESSEISEPEELPAPDEYLIEDFPVVFQLPELLTGCEITAATMALNYYGFDVDKMTMADVYLPCSPENFYWENGRMYGADMESFFIGTPESEFGYICGAKAIVSAIDGYLTDIKSSMEAVNITGAEPEELYKLVSLDTPVVVWITVGMKDRTTAFGWYTEDDEYVEWSEDDHCGVLIGYTEDTVFIADPGAGIFEFGRERFERIFAQRNNRCVIIKEKAS